MATVNVLFRIHEFVGICETPKYTPHDAIQYTKEVVLYDQGHDVMTFWAHDDGDAVATAWHGINREQLEQLEQLYELVKIN